MISQVIVETSVARQLQALIKNISINAKAATSNDQWVFVCHFGGQLRFHYDVKKAAYFNFV